MSPRIKISRESVFRVEGDSFTVRVWRTEHRDMAPVNTALRHKIIEQLCKPGIPPLELAVYILKWPRVSAVEVTDKAGTGEVVYADWPK